MNQKLETLFAGIIYVTLGTAIAVQVSAADKAESCSPTQAPDAMCSVALLKGPEAKLCFGNERPRCFEIRDTHLVQTISGSLAQDSSLKPAELSTVQRSMDHLANWLETSLKTKNPSHSTCRDVITYDVKNSHKEFCASKLSRTTLEAKTREALATLESPSAKTSH